MSSLPPRLAITATGLLVASLVAAGCGRAAHGAQEPLDAPVPVRAALVGAPGPTTVTGTGSLAFKDETPLAFKIGGVIARVSVDEGVRVHAGQVLAALDLREIDAGVAKSTAAAEKSRRDAARAERLYRDSVATLVQLQDARTTRDAADADQRAARVNREYAVITAPSDGVVLRRFTNAGAQVAPGTPVLQFGSASRGSVLRVGLADRDALRVRDGDPASVTFDALAGREFRGRVRQVAAAADARTGTYTVEVALDDPGALPSGLVGRVRITASGSRPSRAATGVATIPAEALVEGGADHGVVFALDATGHTAVRRTVTLVGIDGDRILVRGLDGVRRVVTSGAAWLMDSARVEVRP